MTRRPPSLVLMRSVGTTPFQRLLATPLDILDHLLGDFLAYCPRDNFAALLHLGGQASNLFRLELV